MPPLPMHVVRVASASPGVLVARAALATLGTAAPLAAQQGFEQLVRPFVARHCVACHDHEAREGGLVLTGYRTAASALAAPEVWEYAAERVRLGEMPPRGEPRPDAAAAAAFVAWLEEALAGGDDGAPIDPGAPVLRRLTNAHYRAAVRDLTGVDFDAAAVFPSDAIGHGFDTVGAAQALSALQLEEYVEAAEAVAGRAVAVDDSRPPRVRRLGSEALDGPSALLDTARGRLAVRALYSSGPRAAVTLALPRTATYRIEAGAFAQQAGDEPARLALVVDGRDLAEHAVPDEGATVGTFAVEGRLEAGRRRVAVRFVNDYYQPEAEDPAQRDRNLYVEWIAVTGPLDPPEPTPFQAALRARFGEDERAALAHLVRRAWRRPPRADELERLAALPPAQAAPDERLRLQLAALLASPHFLFLVEADPPEVQPGAVRDLDACELAARLSFFLWGAPPDEALDALADSGALLEPATYERTVRAMLADPRARALADGFATQWLQLAALEQAAPDRRRFPSWDEPLRAAMLEETRRVFDAVLREGRGVHALLDADWTFVNRRLAAHYGLGVGAGEGAADEGADDTFERVSLAGTPRRGVLGHGAVLTVTSDPARTSPVKRGKWVLDVLLGAPPPDPPPGVGALEEGEQAARAASLRERLEAHRARAECAVCHDRMDPLGFGLENYDAVGRWRASDGPHPIDARGTLPDGRSFEGPVELAAVLRGDGRFPRALLEKLLVYALGRGLEAGDRRTVRRLLSGLDSEDPKLSATVLEVARSEAFRRRRVPGSR